MTGVKYIRVIIKNKVSFFTGADPNMKNHEGLTALHQCCIDGTEETVALLLKYGADVNVTDQDLWTPLHAAATCGHFKVVTMLVKAGADVTAVNGDGDMPHDITEEDVTLLYLKNEMMKRNISLEDLEQIRNKPHDLLLSDVESVVAAGGDLNQPVGQKGETFLHVAIAEGHNDIVKFLLDKGASVTVQDEDGWQPVHLAAYWSNAEALELLSTDSTVNFRAETKEGETPYELCDDPNLKLHVLHILKDKRDSSTDSQNSNESVELKDMNGTLTEDTMDTSPPPTINGDTSDIDDELFSKSVEDAPPSPLINIEATELHSDRRSSIKDVKHNAPLKRQASERSSNRERQLVAGEALRPLMLRRDSNEKTSPPSISSLPPENYQEFYETAQPTTQTPDLVKKQEMSSADDSEPESTLQYHQSTNDMAQSTSEPPTPTQSEDIARPEASEGDKMKTDKSQAANSRLEKGAEEELGDGLMLRPRKKKPAPPPPRGSLLDLKRQRSEEREHKLQQGNANAGDAAKYSTISGITYEAPPSPSMIRYKYKMVPDNEVRRKIVRQKKCTVM